MKSWIVWLLFAVICVYSALDVYQTKMLFDCGAIEANPIMQWLIKISGTWRIIIVVKLLVLLFMGYWLWVINKSEAQDLHVEPRRGIIQYTIQINLNRQE